MSKFTDGVINIVKLVPKGKVVSYGQVAVMVGSPRSALQVGWALHIKGEEGITPWWRVVNKDGYISTKCEEHTKNIQKEHLLKEGVEVGKNLKIDMKKFRWFPKYSTLKNLELDEKYIYLLSEKYKI
ncbi:MGMT family protein [Patescibacteria group bacterium]|nr:MGMT family protein [Patescibacteria group bacterium]